MKQIDDLFRDGLSGRKSAVPEDMWSRIKSAKTPLPEGEQLDEVFSASLRDRVGKVPAGMWDRIVAARGRKPMKVLAALAAGLLLLLFTAGFSLYQNGYFTAPVQEETTPVTTPTEPVAMTEELSNSEENIVEASTESDINEGPRTAATTMSEESGPTDGRVSDAVETRQVATAKARNASSLRQPLAPSISALIPSESAAEEPATKLSDTSPGRAPLNAVGDVPATAEYFPSNSKARAAIHSVSEMLAASLTLLPTAATAFPEIKRQYHPRANLTPAFRGSPRHRTQAELLFGIAYANQMFRELDDSQRQLREIREVTEFPQASYQITLRGTYKLGERMMLLGGLTYAEIRNRLEYSQFINGNTVDVTTNNQIRLLEAPLLIGYRIPGRRLQVSMNAGPVINLNTSARGRFLHPDLSAPQNLSADGNYRNNIGVGLMASLSTTYRIGHKEPFLLVVEPFFKSYPGAFTVKDASVREKYWVAGLQLGIRKGF